MHPERTVVYLDTLNDGKTLFLVKSEKSREMKRTIRHLLSLACVVGVTYSAGAPGWMLLRAPSDNYIRNFPNPSTKNSLFDGNTPGLRYWHAVWVGLSGDFYTFVRAFTTFLRC